MSQESTPFILSFNAGGTIAPGRIVKLSTAADNTVLQSTAAAADVPVGVAQRGMRDAPGIAGSDPAIAAIAGDQISVYGPGSIAPVIAGAAFARGAALASDANGRAVTVTAATNTHIVGWALESAGALGEEVQMIVSPQRVGQY